MKKCCLLLACLASVGFSYSAHADSAQYDQTQASPGTYVVGARHAVAPQPPPIPAPPRLSPVDPNMESASAPVKSGDDSAVFINQADRPNGNAEDLCQGDFLGRFRGGERTEITFNGDGTYVMIFNRQAYTMHGNCQMRSPRNASVDFVLDVDARYEFRGQIVVGRDRGVTLKAAQIVSGRVKDEITLQRRQ